MREAFLDARYKRDHRLAPEGAVGLFKIGARIVAGLTGAEMTDDIFVPKR